MNSKVQLVRVTPADIKELQKVSRQTFLETFEADNSPENMQHYLDTEFADEKLLNEINNPGSEFYFAMVDGTITGYLKINIGAAQTELKDELGLELERIYILKEFQGQKIGQILFDKSIEIAKRENKQYLWLGVWEHNYRAIQFYKKNGLIQFSQHVFIMGDDKQIDTMMKVDWAKN